MQTMRRRAGWLLLSALLLLVGSATALAADTVEFQLELPVGKTVVSEYRMAVDAQIDLPEESLHLPLTLRFVLEEAYDQFDEEGILPYATRPVDFELLIDGFPLPDIPSGDELTGVVGGTMGYLDRKGRPVAIQNPAGTPEDIAMDASLLAFFDAANPFAYLPEKPVRIGETWTSETRLELPLDETSVLLLEAEGVYTLVEVEADRATLTYTAKARMTIDLPVEPGISLPFSFEYDDRGTMVVDVQTGLWVEMKNSGEMTLRIEVPDLTDILSPEELAEIPAEELPEAITAKIQVEGELRVLDIKEHEEFPPFPVMDSGLFGADYFDFDLAFDGFDFDFDTVVPPGSDGIEVQLVESLPAGKGLLMEQRIRQHQQVFAAGQDAVDEIEMEMRIRMDLRIGLEDEEGHHPFILHVIDGGIRVPPWPEFPAPEIGTVISGRFSPEFEVVDVVAPPDFDVETFRDVVGVSNSLEVPNDGRVRLGDRWTSEMELPLEPFEPITVTMHFTVLHIDEDANTVLIGLTYEATHEVESETGLAENPMGLIVVELMGSSLITHDLALGGIQEEIARNTSVITLYSGPSIEFIRENPDLEPDAVVIDITEVHQLVLEIRDLADDELP